MPFEQVMAASQGLNRSVEALAAVAACLRLRAEGLHAPPEVDRLVREAAEAAGVGPLDDLSVEQCQMALGAIRAFFRQAADLMDAPDRPCGWITDDATLLQSQGRASAMIAGLIASLAPSMGDLADRLGRPGAAIADLGTGVGWLAIAFARAHPEATVLGVDIAEAPLELARSNVTESGLSDRVALRLGDAANLPEQDAFDLVWVPGPFLSASTVPAVLDRCFRALRPGGWVVFGRYGGPPDPLAATLIDLRVVRSGGHPWRTEEAASLLAGHGFVDVATPERTWSGPMVFSVGRRP